MELEFYQELFLTAVISILFAFLFGKIAGGFHGEGERPADGLASSSVPSSLENLRRKDDEEIRAAADVFGIGEQLGGSRREIIGVEEFGGEIELVKESVDEKMALLVKIEEEEEISEKMLESAYIERVSAKELKESATDLVEEEKGVEEKEASSSYSDVKIVHGQWTEIGSDSGGNLITENKGMSLLHGEDEWEGIERSDLEKLFGVAAEYCVSLSGSTALSRLSSDVQMELYGLHKIATEGPCYESQPLSLKVYARARWNAWQKLGRMTPEVAMDQYITLLSKSIPGWVLESFREDAKLKQATNISEKGILDIRHPDVSSSLQNQLSPAAQMMLEVKDSDEVDSTAGGLKVFDQGLTGTFLLSLLFPTRGVFS